MNDIMDELDSKSSATIRGDILKILGRSVKSLLNVFKRRVDKAIVLSGIDSGKITHYI